MSQLTKPRFIPQKMPVGVFDTFTQSRVVSIVFPGQERRQMPLVVRSVIRLNTDYERSIADPDFVWEMP